MKKKIAGLLVCLLCFGAAACTQETTETGEPAGTETEATFRTADLFTAEGAEVRMADAANAADGTDLSGVLLETGAASYSGAVEGVFEGNTEFTFGFRKGQSVAERRLTFTIASASDPQTSFSVIYEPGWNDPEEGRGRSGAYVKYGSELRTSRYWQSDKHATDPDAWQNNDNFNVDAALASPMFGGEGGFEEEFGDLYGTLSLEWTVNGVLEIYVSERNHDTDARCIAAFDGTAGGVGYSASLGTWGLPRLDIAEGYTVSFVMEVLSGGSEATDMYFSEIVTGPRGSEKTYSLAKECMEVPDFYKK